MIRTFLLSTLLACLASTGCTGELGHERQGNYLEGSFGEVFVAGVPEIRESRLDRDELYVDLRMQDYYGRWAMLGIEVPRGEEDVARVAYGLRGRDVRMIGCSGRTDGNWDYDCIPSPEKIKLDIEIDGDRTRIIFSGEFVGDDCPLPPGLVIPPGVTPPGETPPGETPPDGRTPPGGATRTARLHRVVRSPAVRSIRTIRRCRELPESAPAPQASTHRRKPPRSSRSPVKWSTTTSDREGTAEGQMQAVCICCGMGIGASRCMSRCDLLSGHDGRSETTRGFAAAHGNAAAVQ